MAAARPIPENVAELVEGRFWRKARLNEASGCLEWQGSRDGRGYGRISIGGAWWRAHRIAYALARSVPPAFLLVRHKCDNPACIDPNHLELGDDLLNARDRKDRGREPDRRGRGNGRALLSATDIREIRASPLGHKKLARAYRVGRSTIRDARSGRNWSHVQ